MSDVSSEEHSPIIQSLEHTRPHLFPDEAKKYGFIRYIPQPDEPIACARGPTCLRAKGEALCEEHAHGCLPAFFYKHPALPPCPSSGSDALVFRWTIIVGRNEVKVNSCWYCYTKTISRCPINGLFVGPDSPTVEDEEEDNDDELLENNLDVEPEEDTEPIPAKNVTPASSAMTPLPPTTMQRPKRARPADFVTPTPASKRPPVPAPVPSTPSASKHASANTPIGLSASNPSTRTPRWSTEENPNTPGATSDHASGPPPLFQPYAPKIVKVDISQKKKTQKKVVPPPSAVPSSSRLPPAPSQAPDSSTDAPVKLPNPIPPLVTTSEAQDPVTDKPITPDAINTSFSAFEKGKGRAQRSPELPLSPPLRPNVPEQPVSSSALPTAKSHPLPAYLDPKTPQDANDLLTVIFRAEQGLRQYLKTLEPERIKKQTLFDAQEAELESLKVSKKELERQLRVLDTLLVNLQKDKSSLQVRCDRADSILAERVSELESKANEAGTSLEAYRSRFEIIVSERNTAYEKAETAIKKLKESRDKETSLETELEKKKERVLELELEMSDLEDRLKIAEERSKTPEESSGTQEDSQEAPDPLSGSGKASIARVLPGDFRGSSSKFYNHPMDLKTRFLVEIPIATAHITERTPEDVERDRIRDEERGQSQEEETEPSQDKEQDKETAQSQAEEESASKLPENA